MTILKKKIDEILKISLQLANRFCEDEKKFQLEECLNIVSVFCAKIKIADSVSTFRIRLILIIIVFNRNQ